ncbi:hypothetical protein CSQ88_00490 [Iodobacter sp. BJB302]|nr:hypothetical protein CSQ88_00490 [Iodobacter sp. BJB302]
MASYKYIDMKTTTDLRLEYVTLSWNYNFPSEIETAIEDDYVVNPHLYDEESLERVKLLLLLDSHTPPELALEVAKFKHPKKP